jgi:hypothetical protein
MASAHATLATAVCSPEFGVESEHEHVQGLHSYIVSSTYLVVSTAATAAVQLRVRVLRTASMPRPLPRQSGYCPSCLGGDRCTLQHAHLDDPFRPLLSACLGSLADVSGRTTVRRLKRLVKTAFPMPFAHD